MFWWWKKKESKTNWLLRATKIPQASRDSQVAHGKEELLPSSLAMRSRSETGKISIRAGPIMYGSNSRNVEHSAAAESERVVTTSQTVSPEPRHTLATSNTINDWSPLDDGIEVVLRNGSDKAPSREEVDAHIFGIFRDPTTKRRLPVFAALCEGQ